MADIYSNAKGEKIISLDGSLFKLVAYSPSALEEFTSEKGIKLVFANGKLNKLTPVGQGRGRPKKTDVSQVIADNPAPKKRGRKPKAKAE